jgi:hypothetical protein
MDSYILANNFRDQEFWEPIGNSQPEYYGGFNNSFTIGKHLTIAVNISYRFGSHTLIQKELLDHYRVIFSRNMPVNIYYDSWRNPGDIALYPAVVDNQPLISNSSKYLYNTSRIKLNSVNISYNIRTRKGKLPVDNLRVFLNASNLWQWYLEQPVEGRNGIAQLNNVYPEMRTLSLGISTNF